MAMPVVLDPGHGGGGHRGNPSPDPRLGDRGGAPGVDWELAQQVSRHLGGVQLTRGPHDDRSPGDRSEHARRLGAGAFVSLHARPGGGGGIWVHSRGGPESAQLAEEIRRHVAPAWGGCEVARGDLAVLAPDRLAPGTAACLVEVGTGPGGAPSPGAAAAIARGVRAHFGRQQYGRSGAARDRGLDVAPPILEGSFLDVVRTIADWLSRQVTWRAGVPDTHPFPFSAICNLSFTDEDGSTWGGTGFYISPNRLLTAAHNVIDYNPRSNRLSRTVSMRITPALNGALEPYGHFEIADRGAFVEHPGWIRADGSEDERFDLGVIKVDGHPPPNGQFFSNLDARPVSVANVAICGYAAGDLDSTRQHCDIDFVRNVSSDMETGDYNASTEHGTSGAPVFYTPQQQGGAPDIGVVGVHVTSKSVAGTPGDDRRYNMFCRLTDPKLNWIWSV